MKKIRPIIIWSQIILQTALPVLGTLAPVVTASETGTPFSDQPISSSFSTDRSSPPSQQNDATLPYANQMDQTARMLSSGRSAEAARTLATGEASGALQTWLRQFGNARIQLNVDRHGNWDHSAGDLLLPFYDEQKLLLFIQGGIRNPDDRVTGNLGIGARTFWPSGWMTGANFFFDNDFTGRNRRIGIGGEAWADYLRLAANTYLRMTQWHDSRDFDDRWQEKPANGYDIRAEGWLPAWPQLGAKLAWEQYYGNQVALFTKDHLQHNPWAITAGLEYNPIPLVSFAVDQKQGKSEHDTQLTLGLHWRFGQDWRWQIEPDNVRALHTLAGNRYELVNRNNEIVLQYRKKADEGVAHLALTAVTDNSPADGNSRNLLQVLATNRDGQPVRNAPVNWSVPADSNVQLSAATGVTDNNGIAIVALTSTKVQRVPVTVQSENVVASQTSSFIAVAVNHIALNVARDNAQADGNTPNIVVATLTDSNNQPVSGQKLTWQVPAKVTLKNGDAATDSSGKITVQLLSTTACSAAVSAIAGNQSANSTVHFIGDDATARISALTLLTDGSPADGKTTNMAQATITDANGTPIAGQAVTWKSDKSTVKFMSPALTDSKGNIRVAFTDTVAESPTLTASLTNGQNASTSSLFIDSDAPARLAAMLVTSGAAATGHDPNTATVTVTDGNNKPLANTAVSFSVTGNAKLTSDVISTDGEGKAQVLFTDTQPETVQVTVKLDTGSRMTKDSHFVDNADNATLNLTATNALADGNNTSAVTATLKDRNGKPLSGVDISLTVTGNAKLSATSIRTDGNGQATATLTDTTAETVKITASPAKGPQATAEAIFNAFGVSNLSANPKNAKTSESVTLTATVTDSSNKPVAETPVAFTVTGSASLSSATATTNSNGQAQVTLTDTKGESVTVTAKAQRSSEDAGKNINVAFTAGNITDLVVENSTAGRKFTVDKGFPTTGFNGAKFRLLVNEGSVNTSDYRWSSNQSWVSVNNGTVTFSGVPTSASKTVTISATPVSGGAALTYTFTMKYWFTISATGMKASEVDSYCASIGQSVPPWTLLDYVDYGTTNVGSLWGEWADSMPKGVNLAAWALEQGRNSRYYMFTNNGHVYDNAPGKEYSAACMTSL